MSKTCERIRRFYGARSRITSLVFEQLVVGRKTKTNISIAYINGLAKPALVSEVKKRIKSISTDAILESGYIEQYIEDSPGSIYATVGYTEKPDVAAAKILEGRVAVIVDGTPFVLTAPFLFLESFQAAEDYYFRPYFATFTRIIRIIGLRHHGAVTGTVCRHHDVSPGACPHQPPYYNGRRSGGCAVPRVCRVV